MFKIYLFHYMKVFLNSNKFQELISTEMEYPIDVVPDLAIWTVNWLQYLNYEAIPLSSSTRH